KMDARHHLTAESNSKYDYIMHREKKPRDTIPRLQKPGTEPPQYATSTNEMLGIATNHHDSIQRDYEFTLTEEERNKHMEETLDTLKPRLNNRERTRMGRRLRGKEVRNAIMSIANGKASGLDGIPIEVWKHLVRAHEDAEKCRDKGEQAPETANIVKIITTVLNDIVRHGVTKGTAFAEGW
ncbi:hypothetical protein DFP72DRAFT_768371, partial [Ephemerocybe angulata]